jgi:hypothetical protein
MRLKRERQMPDEEELAEEMPEAATGYRVDELAREKLRAHARLETREQLRKQTNRAHDKLQETPM